MKMRTRMRTRTRRRRRGSRRRVSRRSKRGMRMRTRMRSPHTLQAEVPSMVWSFLLASPPPNPSMFIAFRSSEGMWNTWAGVEVRG